LFVPASRPELFEKALASEADALSFDLEDAVVEARKATAREELVHFLQGDLARRSTKTLIVRVNAMTTEHFHADIAAVAASGADMVNLPMAMSGVDVRKAGAALDALDTSSIALPKLLLNIETPAALRQASEIASAHPRVVGLQLGLGDLFEPLGIARDNPAAVQQVQLTLRLAAGEAGVNVFDGAYPDITDLEGFKREAQTARRLGFTGKSCIHPSQVATANAAFLPTDDEISHALAVEVAWRTAKAEGKGAFTVEGRMVDGPYITRALEIAELARQLGLGEPTGERSR
jgi:citrate lyase subunit beta/citryl-CoA lyase